MLLGVAPPRPPRHLQRAVTVIDETERPRAQREQLAGSGGTQH